MNVPKITSLRLGENLILVVTDKFNIHEINVDKQKILASFSTAYQTDNGNIVI
jgi:hypothetical protein